MKKVEFVFLTVAAAFASEAQPAYGALCGDSMKYDLKTILVDGKDRYVLCMPENHVPGLAIVDPEGRWFYVADPTVQDKRAKEFQQKAAYVVDPETLVGTVYERGDAGERRVFSVPGLYRFYLADNLETEPENAIGFEFEVTYSVGDETVDEE